MNDHPGLRDLGTGAAAATVLLLLSLLGLSLWLAVPLASLVYIAAVRLQVAGYVYEAVRDRLLFRRAYLDATASLEAIVSMIPRISDPPVRSRVSRIADQSALVLITAHGDRNLADLWAFNERVLRPFRALLAGYIELASRKSRSGSELLSRIETRELARVDNVIESFYEKLHRSQIIDVATLASILEFSIEGLDSPASRRSVS